MLGQVVMMLVVMFGTGGYDAGGGDVRTSGYVMLVVMLGQVVMMLVVEIVRTSGYDAGGGDVRTSGYDAGGDVWDRWL